VQRRDNQHTKDHHFELGSFKPQFKSTNSAAFVTPGSNAVERFTHTPIQNIYFGDSKVKKLSTVQADFTEKSSERPTANELQEIKALHHNCHFNLGSLANDYQATSNDYRAFSTTPTRKAARNASPSIVLGSYKAKNTTEAMASFTEKGKAEKAAPKEFDMKAANFSLGSCVDVTVATSAAVYKGEQVRTESQASAREAQANNIILGNSQPRWQSSYQNSFSEQQNVPPMRRKSQSPHTNNFALGSDTSVSKTLFQDSYGRKYNPVPVEKCNKVEPMVYLGQYKSTFSTANGTYGTQLAAPARLSEETLENMKKVNFSFGNDKPEYVSKFQTDFGAAPSLQRGPALQNANKASNIVFGANKSVWKSTSSSVHTGK
jgi:hypothetical protein